MKKALIVFMLSMVLSIALINAQNVNIVGGLNYAKVLERVGFLDDINVLNNIKGPYFEVNIESCLNLWSDEGNCFVAGFAFSTKGYGFSFIETFNDIPVKFVQEVHLYYLEFPFTIKTWINIHNNIDFYFKYGVYASSGIKGKNNLKISALGENVAQTYEIEWGNNPIEHDFKPYDFGLALGLGFELGKIIAGISLNYGLNNIYPDSQIYLKNKTVTIYAGYSITKKRRE